MLPSPSSSNFNLSHMLLFPPPRTPGSFVFLLFQASQCPSPRAILLSAVNISLLSVGFLQVSSARCYFLLHQQHQGTAISGHRKLPFLFGQAFVLPSLRCCVLCAAISTHLLLFNFLVSSETCRLWLWVNHLLILFPSIDSSDCLNIVLFWCVVWVCLINCVRMLS